jgi:hypothetical protein
MRYLKLFNEVIAYRESLLESFEIISKGKYLSTMMGSHVELNDIDIKSIQEILGNEKEVNFEEKTYSTNNHHFKGYCVSYIKSRFIISNGRITLRIFKAEDEYYLVHAIVDATKQGLTNLHSTLAILSNSDEEYFECDQLVGLTNLLKSLSYKRNKS